jgi:hypothetical protein
MMNEFVIEYDGLSLMDVAVQVYGSITGVIQLASDNNISITDDLAIGQVLKIDSSKIIDARVVKELAK